MTSNLEKRIEAMLTAIERAQEQQTPAYHVVLYDPETGEALAGHESPGNGVTFYLPKLEHEQGYKA